VTDLRGQADFKEVLRNVTTAYVSDARWPPPPTSPGRFNVNEALDALTLANDNMAALLKARKLNGHCGLCSVNIMGSQIAAARDELMAMPYFEESNVKIQ
jgi:hypothetical protein